jgi:hypothetical protein
VLIELGDDLASRPLAKSRRHITGIPELVPLIVADEERAECAAGGGGAMPAADDKFLVQPFCSGSPRSGPAIGAERLDKIP